ncbi:MAG: HAD family hydrolase [Cyanothece sp. SIO1E1]|nr:HAD family hydrolase [Cyanothece sp. SIO1E1]
MPKHGPTILALDFDGVICDGLIEYFQTAWQVYCQIWLPTNQVPPEGLAPIFYHLRPVVETGWEMPVLIHAIRQGVPEAEILYNWPTLAQQYIAAEDLNKVDIAAKVDGVRDQWIATDLPHWLTQHRFFPGVIERLQQLIDSSIEVVIISTKEGRFIHQLLLQQQIDFPPQKIFGKEIRQPKHQTLRQLIQPVSINTNSEPKIWFIEDRLKTLHIVQQQPDLTAISLFLADWGYNTPADRDTTLQEPRIQLLSLQQFNQDFTHWPRHS